MENFKASASALRVLMANSGSVYFFLNNLSFANSDAPKELKDELNKRVLSAGFVFRPDSDFSKNRGF